MSQRKIAPLPISPSFSDLQRTLEGDIMRAVLAFGTLTVELSVAQEIDGKQGDK